MKHLFLLALGASFLTAEAIAAPPKEVIDQCMKASDFEGCVKVMTGQTDTEKETKITVDIDKIRNTGNMCPDGWGYLGGGYCKDILCFRNYSAHNWRLGGIGWACNNGRTLQWDGEPVRASTDERCPLEEPEIGRENSCWNGLSEEEINNGIRIYRQKPSKKVRYGFHHLISIEPKGIKIDHIFKGCAAAKARLMKGDIVTSINGLTFSIKSERNDKLFKELVSKQLPNKFKIIRYGEERTITIKPSMCSNQEGKYRWNPKTGERTYL